MADEPREMGDNNENGPPPGQKPKLVFGEYRDIIRIHADIVEPMPAEWFEKDGDDDWEEWDRQVEADSAEGKLDSLLSQATEAKRQGHLTDL